MKNQLEAAAIYATTSDADHWSPWRWSTLSAWLNNAVARAIYVIPFAGYFILYSDYFEKLFSFSTLHGSGFLTTMQRLDMSYYGSVALLVAYVLYQILVPPLLRGKRDSHQFIADLTAAHDAPALAQICYAVADYVESLDITRLSSSAIAQLDILRNFARRQADSGRFATIQHADLPTVAMRFYYNWKNEARPLARYVVFAITIVGLLSLLLPAFDLFLRVAATTFHRISGA